MSISTCALREEGDRCLPTTRCVDSYFYPRPPRGGRRGSAGDHHPLRNFYPRPPRGGRRCGAACFHLPDMISIHALREEGDRVRVAGEFPRQEFLSTPSARRATDVKATAYNKALISIHALREEGDVCWLYIRFVAKRFLSTPSARRATSTYRFDSGKVFNFYPRPPRGGRRAEAAKNRAWQISIHALREEGDSAHLAKSGLKLYFYPRPPRGGRHHRPYSQYLQQNISIHALREEGDRHSGGSYRQRTDFYPRPPRGGRPFVLFNCFHYI